MRASPRASASSGRGPGSSATARPGIAMRTAARVRLAGLLPNSWESIAIASGISGGVAVLVSTMPRRERIMAATARGVRPVTCTWRTNSRSIGASIVPTRGASASDSAGVRASAAVLVKGAASYAGKKGRSVVSVTRPKSTICGSVENPIITSIRSSTSRW